MFAVIYRWRLEPDHEESFSEEEGERLMAAAVAERLPTTTMTLLSDLLAPPG